MKNFARYLKSRNIPEGELKEIERLLANKRAIVVANHGGHNYPTRFRFKSNLEFNLSTGRVSDAIVGQMTNTIRFNEFALEPEDLSSLLSEKEEIERRALKELSEINAKIDFLTESGLQEYDEYKYLAYRAANKAQGRKKYTKEDILKQINKDDQNS